MSVPARATWPGPPLAESVRADSEPLDFHHKPRGEPFFLEASKNFQLSLSGFFQIISEEFRILSERFENISENFTANLDFSMA